MRGAVLGDGALNFRVSGAIANLSRNRVPDDTGVDAAADYRAVVPEPDVIDAAGANLRRGEFLRHRHPRRLLEDVVEWPAAFDVDGEVGLREIQIEGRGLLQSLANSGERLVGRFLCGHHGRATKRETHPEDAQSHEIRTMMPRVQLGEAADE